MCDGLGIIFIAYLSFFNLSELCLINIFIHRKVFGKEKSYNKCQTKASLGSDSHQADTHHSSGTAPAPHCSAA